MQLFLVFSIAFSTTAILIWTRGMHVGMTGDSDLGGVQKVHGVSVPRIGGLAVFCSLALYAAATVLPDAAVHRDAILPLLLACSLPAFVSGIFEDITKSVSPAVRLAMTMLAALLACLLLSAVLDKVGIPWVDDLLSLGIIALPVTLIAVAGVANSINLIDGYNGLAAGVSISILLGIGALANWVDQSQIVNVSMLGAAALMGFLAWNFPFGRIFLGDGGAYFTGFLAAELAIMLAARSDAIHPLSLLLLAAYPVTETLFSIARRRLVGGKRACEPDARHLHHLVHSWIGLQRWSTDTRLGDIRNPLTSVVLWSFNALAVVPAVYLRDEPIATFAWLMGYVLCYGAAYGVLHRLGRQIATLAGRPWLEY
ncbi:MraY family glycosyltransferase [Bordetella bronchialis]|uniref:MraY family glycosyltransferase n=1 Tax=Bordetella bronchialis TaxID=463025 RepID=UPI003CFDAE03